MKLKIVNCKICNKEFNTKIKNICYDCVYNNTFFDKTCIKCGTPFKGKRLQKQCEKCRKNAHKNSNFKNFHTITRICKSCGKIIDVIKKVNCGLYNQNNIVFNDINCKECKRKILSEYQKLNNTNVLAEHFDTIDEYNKIKTEKRVLKHKQFLDENIKLLDELRKIEPTANFKFDNPYKERLSLLMRLNNPMFNLKTRNKMKITLNNRIKQGLITYTAKNRKNYTGCSRTIQNYLRSELYLWRKTLLEQSNYSCELCNHSGGMLHVHHTIPYREILKMVCAELNLSSNILKEIKFSDETYCKIKEKLLYFHSTHDCGIVVCPKCHAIIDKFYHLEKKYENTEN